MRVYVRWHEDRIVVVVNSICMYESCIRGFPGFINPWKKNGKINLVTSWNIYRYVQWKGVKDASNVAAYA